MAEISAAAGRGSRPILFITLGTSGDALPFAAIAGLLRRRSHDVTMLSNANHRPLAEAEAVPFVAVCEPEWPQVNADPQAFFAEQQLPAYARIAEEIAARAAGGNRPFVVSRFGNWGAAFSCEALGLSYVNILLQPDAIWEKGEPLPPERLPLVNRFRDRLGLSPIAGTGVLEPAVAKLSLFPDWFGYPEALSPAAGECLGFPLRCVSAVGLSEGVRAFIAAHGAPIVCTLGTGVTDVSTFLEPMRRLHRETGRAVLFLSRFAHPDEADEGTGFRVEAFVDHRSLFPEAAIVVHNGGVGVTAEALRAGVPQLVVPLVWDQPDNAARIAALGVGHIVDRDGFGWERVRDECSVLDAIDRRVLKVVAAAIGQVDAVRAAADRIEELLATAD